MSIVIKKDNTSPSIISTLTDEGGTVINLTGASIVFKTYDSTGTIKTSAAASIVGTATDGVVQYDWVAGDTDTVGEYSAVFEVTYADSSVESFPLNSYIRLSVLPDAADWTYGGDPGTSTASQRRDTVRFLLGDTDPANQLIKDTEISFLLANNADDTYRAASNAAFHLAVKYANLPDIEIDTLKLSNSQRSKRYQNLASQLSKEARTHGTSGMGLAIGGGLSKSTMASVESDTDRVENEFKIDAFGDDRA